MGTVGRFHQRHAERARHLGLESGFLLVQFGTAGDSGTFYFYAFVGFLAGFSERFTQVIFGEAELTVAQALGGKPAGRGDAVPPVEEDEEREAEIQPTA